MKNTSVYMNELYQLARRPHLEYLERTPPLEWAQSLNEVFLRIKFTQRHDIPGCINHKDLQVDIQKDRFYLEAFCGDKEMKIKYQLNFTLWGTIKPKKSNWIEESVGGILVTLIKNP